MKALALPNERIKNMEFAVDLNVAKLEADTARIESAFNSINETIASSNEAVVGLAEVFSNTESSWDQSVIQSYMKKQQTMAENAAKKQGELIDAQIRSMDAATQKMESGEALITVDGGDLQPELDAIMKSLFKNIRIEMSQTYENYLLGIPA